ncbi:MAG: hypothetical protein JRG71_10455 [Deltaproteobacteria bacterium]|nr:hypothetical protein [Deltaproteobacteria bacterium]
MSEQQNNPKIREIYLRGAFEMCEKQIATLETFRDNLELQIQDARDESALEREAQADYCGQQQEGIICDN